MRLSHTFRCCTVVVVLMGDASIRIASGQNGKPDHSSPKVLDKPARSTNGSPNAAASVNPKVPAKKITNTNEILPNSNFKTEIQRAKSFFVENKGIGVVVKIPPALLADPQNKADIEAIGQKLSARFQRDEIPSHVIIIPRDDRYDYVSLSIMNGNKNDVALIPVFVTLAELDKAKMDEIVRQFRIETYEYETIPSASALNSAPVPRN
jgi:hypothetical protein